MLRVTLICVGKLKEKYFLEASREYEKRLSSYCRLTLHEVEQTRLPQSPSDGEIAAALETERQKIEKLIPKGSYLMPMCIEGKQLDSEALSRKLNDISMLTGDVTFVIGGSFGLHNELKQRADFKLSISAMTFPHRLARIMLLEQIYRGFKIAEGSAYHK